MRRLVKPVFSFGLLFLLTNMGKAQAAEGEVLVVEQDYKIVNGEKLEETKDIRQKLYLSADLIRIDEFCGEGKAPSESFLIDLKNKTVINMDNLNQTKTTETFAKREERIETRKKKARADIDNLPDGPQKEKTIRIYRALLDDERNFEMGVIRKEESKEFDGEKAECVTVLDAKDPRYAPMKVYLHAKAELPYDSAEVLYLLQIIGGKMREFLNKNKSYFRRLPMEMELDLAAGGTLHTKVIRFEKIDRQKLDKDIFEPADFKERTANKPSKPTRPIKTNETTKTVEPD